MDFAGRRVPFSFRCATENTACNPPTPLAGLPSCWKAPGERWIHHSSKRRGLITREAFWRPAHGVMATVMNGPRLARLLILELCHRRLGLIRGERPLELLSSGRICSRLLFRGPGAFHFIACCNPSSRPRQHPFVNIPRTCQFTLSIVVCAHAFISPRCGGGRTCIWLRNLLDF